MSHYSSRRNTIVVEDCQIVQHTAYPAQQFVLRLRAPQIAARAQAGSFVHLQCDISLPMRRPMSLMRVDPLAGTIDILYKAHGLGTAMLARRAAGQQISVMGPIGVPFKLRDYRARPLLIGGGVGIPPMIYLAEHMKNSGAPVPLVIMGSEIAFPFTLLPSTILVPGMPPGVIASMPLLEDWRIPSRLASWQNFNGCFNGYVTDLARAWLDAMTARNRRQVEIFACGPTPMLQAVRSLALTYDLPCQISLEEYMACAVGGCAGCAVRIETETGPAMKRACVDGPVFEAKSVIF